MQWSERSGGLAAPSGVADGSDDPSHRVAAQIYSQVFQLPFGDFKAGVLERVREAVPFDTGVWGSGVHSSNLMLSLSYLGQPPETLLQYAERWQAEDFVRAAAAANPGRAFRNEDVMPLADYHQTAIYREFSRPAGIEHALAVAQHDPVTDLGEVVFLFRSDPGQPFTDAERTLLERLSVHLATAWRQRQIAHLYQVAVSGGSPGLQAVEGYAAVGPDRFVRAVGDAFCLALRTAAPDWRGPGLPRQMDRLLDGRVESVRLGDFEFRVQPAEDHFLISARPARRGQGLTPAETQVAELYAEGLTQAQIARRLGTSPSTVRNQIASVYDKLGVRSKAELVRHAVRPAP